MKPIARRTVLCSMLAVGCHTGGSDWMAQPLTGHDDFGGALEPAPNPAPRVKGPPKPAPVSAPRPSAATLPIEGGNVLGTFRNTYYDFPNEAEFDGEAVDLMAPSCQLIKKVKKGFHDAVCVQGSGFLTTGRTVSFARRDCPCARVCPRTEQRICFDVLSVEDFPWGRGALGKPITPLLTVAVDDSVIPMGAALYVPELAGLPRDLEGRATHDGCFIAQDRGLKVKGQHIDVFTGESAMTRVWNERVPSNQGVTVVLDSSRCGRAASLAPRDPDQ